MKDAADIILYEHMIWDIKPKSIIEIGTAQGGNFTKFTLCKSTSYMKYRFILA